MPHMIDKKKVYITFVGFNTKSQKLKRLKIAFDNGVISDGIDYIVYDYFNNFDTNLSDEPASKDNFTIEVLESIQSNSSANKKSSFNFNKTNNYKKFNFNKTNK